MRTTFKYKKGRLVITFPNSNIVVRIKSNLGKSVTVRPLVKMTGRTGFNEVLFDDLVIPDEYRLDDVGAGW